MRVRTDNQARFRIGTLSNFGYGLRGMNKMRYSKLLLLGLLAVGSQANAGYQDYVVQYEKPVNLPSCNPSNPKVKIIQSNSDWSAINDSKYQIFCVKPGNYSGANRIKITQSGTQNAKRYIRYYSNNDRGKMPWKQSVSERAIVKAMEFKGANWWVVDRITVTDPKYTLATRLIDVTGKSTNNVFNRLLLEKNNHVLFRITEGSNNTTLQNSVLRKTKINNRTMYSCIYIAVRDPFGPTVNPHIVNNEIYDCGEDGVQTNSNTRDTNPKYGIHGLVIENNDFYVTPDYYTDGRGNMNRKGPYSCTENALDIKVGTFLNKPSDKQIARIIRNRMWGFRLTEPSTGLCDQNNDPAAAAIIFHFRTSTKVLVQYNIIFDSENGVWIGKNGPRDISFIANIFYDVSNKTNPRSAMDLGRGTGIEAYYNVVSKTSQYMNGGSSKADIRNNMFLNAGTFGRSDFGTGSTVGNNIYYGTTPYKGKKDIGGNMKTSNVASAKNQDFCFKYRKQTNPSTKCIPKLFPTKNSPYRKGAYASTGEKGGIGVDNVMWIQNNEWNIMSAGYPPAPPRMW